MTEKLENLHGTATGPITQWITHQIIGLEADGPNLATFYLLISRKNHKLKYIYIYAEFQWTIKALKILENVNCQLKIFH